MLVLVVVASGVSVYATATYLASEVEYNKNGQAKVSDALNDLYSKVPSGTENITSNGTYNIANKESVNVNVPIPNNYKVIESFTGEFCLSAYGQENNNAKESYCDINTTNYKNLKINITSILTASSQLSYYECKIYGDNSEILTINSKTTYEIDVSQYSKIRIYYNENTGWYRVKGNYVLSN